jgi:hypothetical protein
MATTYTLQRETVFGDRRIRLFYVSDTSYPSNGILMTAALLGLAYVDYPIIPVAASNLYWATFDPTYYTVRLWTATATEYASSAGLFWALVMGS